jgi:hypothetical protein
MGGLPAFDGFLRFTRPQIILHKLAFWRDSHACAQTIPALSALKINQEAHFIASFLNIQADLVFSCSGKKMVTISCFVPGLLSNMQLHISCIATPRQ